MESRLQNAWHMSKSIISFVPIQSNPLNDQPLISAVSVCNACYIYIYYTPDNVHRPQACTATSCYLWMKTKFNNFNDDVRCDFQSTESRKPKGLINSAQKVSSVNQSNSNANISTYSLYSLAGCSMKTERN